MPSLHSLTRAQRETLNERVLQLFIAFCGQAFQFTLYQYEIDVARELLSSIFVWPHDVYVKEARQSGKTETLTLLVRCLIVFLEAITGSPLLCGIASPKGEQAKTDVDRIKKSIPILREHFQVEDRESNDLTVRAYRFGRLTAEIFRFSLAPTTTNESKTLNLLVMEESHKCDHQKRADQLDPMLSNSNGSTWHFGVGCPVTSDYKRGCDGQLPDSVAIWVDVNRVIRDRRAMFEKTGDPKHLDYQKLFERLLRKLGRQNPEIRRNYYLEDTVEEGNFVSRDRLIRLARKKPCCADVFFVGIDWARRSDYTWVTVVNDKCDVVTFFKYDHVQWEEQIAAIKRDLEPYKGRIQACYCDSTGPGDFPTEYLENHSSLPIGDEGKIVFSQQTKNALYTTWEACLFKNPDDPEAFSYPADHPLAAEFEEQAANLVREYRGNGEYLVPHAPEVPGAYDDAPTSVTLALLAAQQGVVGDILIG